MKAFLANFHSSSKDVSHPRAALEGAQRAGTASPAWVVPLPTLLLIARKWAESVAACPVTILLKTRGFFADRTNGGGAFNVVDL